MLFTAVSSSKLYVEVDLLLCGFNFAPQRSLTQICWTKEKNIKINEDSQEGGQNEDVLKFEGAHMSWCL